jgi:hypothetical protein
MFPIFVIAALSVPFHLTQKSEVFSLGHVLDFQALKLSHVSLGFNVFMGLRQH